MPTPSESQKVLQVVCVAAVLVLAALYRRVAREEQARERIATDEMWARTLQDYQHDKRGASGESARRAVGTH